MKVTAPTTFLALFDMHIGWEKMRSRGTEAVMPTYNKAAINAVKHFAKDLKPNALVLVGDQLNCGPISHWIKGQPRLGEAFRLKTEMDLLDNFVLTQFDKCDIKMWFKGNHEIWIQNHIDANPAVEGLIEPESYLHLGKRGYDIFEQGEVGSLGKLNFVHGDVALRGGSVNPAKTLVMAYRRNIRAGHLHCYSAAVDTTPVDARDWHTGIIVPSLSTRNPAYMKNNPSCFMNGFLYGYVYPDGSFWDTVVIINNGKFVVNGSVYDGRKN